METTRRRFVAYFSGVGLGSTLLPGVLWAKMQETGAVRVTAAMIEDALALAGLEFTEEAREGMVRGVNGNLERYEELRTIPIPDDVAPPTPFTPLVPGMEVDRERRPFRQAPAPAAHRPADLEDVAFWPVSSLAELVRTRQVTAVELSEMYLARLRRYNGTLNAVVTFLDDFALAQARRADAEIAAGRYRGPLHGIPWGAKDIIDVKGQRTTWGSDAFEDRISEVDAAVVERLNDAGAVLVAKLSTGELAHGDQWFGGRTNNPWNPQEGSSGSSAGPGAATGAGCVGFAIGTDTAGSIMSPSARCGVTGLVPTSGRVSRYGVMTLNWSLDRIGPMCRAVEDCALVMDAISGPDERDLGTVDIPFNYDGEMDIRALRVGYLEGAFDHDGRRPDWRRNDRATLERLRSLGLELVPVPLPEFPGHLITMAVESSAFFDEFVRSGRVERVVESRQNSLRANRTVPAVEYIQTLRLRSMMMRQLAEATAGVDVYVAPSTNGDAAGSREAEGDGAPRRGTATEHFRRANDAGYPAAAVPNGFSSDGTPTSISFVARPYGETALLAVAKAYQDATDFHRRRPPLHG